VKSDFIFASILGWIVLFFFWSICLLFIFLRKPPKSKLNFKLVFRSFVLFLFGLIIGPIFYSFSGNEIVSILTNSMPLLIIGGLLVGVGTKIGNGCTSGHGVCGISRFSLRSIIATITFIVTGVITVFIFGI